MKRFIGSGRLLLTVLSFLAGTSLAFAQGQVTVSGTIVDENNAPMIGVGIVEQGTLNGVISDIDGNYSIEVPEGATLEFSCVGYITQQHRAVEGTLDIAMMVDSRSLDEVVVVGYGVQKKSSVTGSVSSVKSEDLEARTITRVEQALQGKTAGVQVLSSSARPGASPQVRIRGVSSNGSSDPLYVVDGRIQDDIGGIDPNDIESMEVLKDAASAAIYGAEAGNGVILITTKRGSGNGRITYDFQLTSQSLAKVPQMMNSEQYIDYYTEAGLISYESFFNNWDFETNTDWTKVAFENSLMQRHNLTFSAGDADKSIYLSMSYLNNNGMIVGDSDTYDRITGMINASWKIKPWLEIGTNNQIEYYKAQSVAEGSEYGSLLLSVLTLDPLTKPTYTVDDMPQYMRDIMNNSSYGELLNDGHGNYYGISNFVTSESPNPLIMRDRSFTRSRGFNINGTTYINFMPIEGLTVTSRLGYRLSGSESYGVGQDYYATITAQQNFLSVNASTYTPTYWQWENFANYNKTFKGGHNLGAMVGMSYSESRNFGVSGSYQGSNEDIGFKQDDPLFWYFAYATATATKNVYGGEPSYNRKYSYFGRVNYDYQGKYLFQASLRADAADSSILPIDNRWGYFPAVSAGWVISQEDFMKDTKNWLTHLKFRASWGQNGSTASLGGYSYATVVASTGNYPTGNGLEYLPGYGPSATGNNELKWETSEQTNFGIDSRFFNDRLSFSVDWYAKQTKDLIVTGITPSTVVGNTASPVNAGNVTNSGFEFELGWQDSVGDLFYSVRGNLATLKNEVTYIHESLDAIDGTTFHTYGAITRFETGMPAWYFYGYQFDGIDPATGNPTFVDVNGDGSITDSDKTYIGKGLADFTYGLTFNLAWKGIDFILFATGSYGNDIYSCLNRSDYTLNKLTYFTEDRWTETNTDGTMPRAGANGMDQYMTSSASVFDGSYVKIKQMQLGYTFPQSWMEKIKVQNLRVYVSLDDYFTFASYPGFDPEVTGIGNALGVDKGSYPTSKKVVFGLSLTF